MKTDMLKEKLKDFFDYMDGDDFDVRPGGYWADRVVEIIESCENKSARLVMWKQPSFEEVAEGVIKVGVWNDFEFKIAESSIKHPRNEYFLSTIFMNSDIEIIGQDNYSHSIDRLKMIAENFVSEFLEKYKSI